MDLIVVKADQSSGQVSFKNYVELKESLQSYLTVYETTKFSLGDIERANEAKEELKKIKGVLDAKKKEINNGYLAPLAEFNKKIDELITMVKKPLKVVENLITEYEQSAKEDEIREYARSKAEVLGDYAEKVLSSPAFFNNKWLYKSYKKKAWQNDINKIMRDAADALEDIENSGGKYKAVLKGFYFDKLSFDGKEKFLESISEDSGSERVGELEDEDAVVGYKVLKIYGTERQMRQLLTQLSLAEYEFEEIEDGMPKAMEEIVVPDFNSFVAFDIEHTGTFGINKGDAESEIIEIGAVKVDNGEIVDRFDMFANPGRKIVPRVARLTKISDEMVKNEPPVGEIIKLFKEFTGDSIMVGHNIKSCDIPHIVRAAKRAGVNFDNAFFDTKCLANKIKTKKGWEKITLPYLAEYYHIEQKEAHRAWCDAEVNAHIYLELKHDWDSEK